MGCKFSKGICFRRKRKKTSRENKESGKHLKTRGRREVLAKHEGEIETDEKLLVRGKANDKEAVKTLVQVGLDESIANELVLRQEKGFLASTKDVVAILEKNNKKYQLHLGENILVRVNSLGQLSCKNFGDETHEENSKQNGIDSKQKINLNSASKNALETIKGIGPMIADRIIQYRQEHGPFAKIEDIVSVRGVSEKLLEKISLQVTVESSKSNDVENDEKRRTSTNQTVPRVSDGTVRIASWNLLSFSSDKADNTGVREVICRTILENEYVTCTLTSN